MNSMNLLFTYYLGCEEPCLAKASMRQGEKPSKDEGRQAVDKLRRHKIKIIKTTILKYNHKVNTIDLKSDF
jgi:hypothetical protein